MRIFNVIVDKRFAIPVLPAAREWQWAVAPLEVASLPPINGTIGGRL